MRLHDRAADRQAHAQAFAAGGIEGLEQLVELPCLDARAGILDPQQCLAVGLPRRGDAQLALPLAAG